MKREQLEHVLRASAVITQESNFVVIGSQSILFEHPDAPEELVMSNELDLYPALRPERAELIEGAIGVMSPVHDTFGYHADGVGPETAVMPDDWMTCARLHYIGELTVVVPDLHDIATAKSVAGRDKDARWVAALLRHRLIDPAKLLERISALNDSRHPVAAVLIWARRRIQESLP